MTIQCQYDLQAQLDHIITFLLHPGITFNVSIICWAFIPGLEVIKLEYSLRLKINCNDWLLADTCPQTVNHCALFWVWEWTKVLFSQSLLRQWDNRARHIDKWRYKKNVVYLDDLTRLYRCDISPGFKPSIEQFKTPLKLELLHIWILGSFLFSQ